MKTSRNAKKYQTRFWILAILLFLSIFASLMLGRYRLSPGEIVSLVMNRLRGTESTGAAVNVLFEIRLPRVIVAALVGAALTVSGTTYQGMFRNPMASPDVLGASTGAGFGAALAILLGFNSFGIGLSAFCFSLVAVAAAWLIASRGRGDPVLSLVLSGMIVSALFSAGTSYTKLVADTQNQLPAITYWLMGSLSSVKKSDVLHILLPFLVGLLPLSLLRWRMNLLTVSEDEARSMGVNTRRLRFIAMLCATLLTASAVSVAGMIGWVGLALPHFCRMLFGYDYRRLIPAGAMMGATFLLITDDIARLASTGEIPLGILTAAIGAPVFLILLLTRGDRYGA